MMDVMYELPEMEHKGKYVITPDIVRGERKLFEKKAGATSGLRGSGTSSKSDMAKQMTIR